MYEANCYLQKKDTEHDRTRPPRSLYLFNLESCQHECSNITQYAPNGSSVDDAKKEKKICVPFEQQLATENTTPRIDRYAFKCC